MVGSEGQAWHTASWALSYSREHSRHSAGHPAPLPPLGGLASRREL